jgi:hypothetical protein
VLDLSLRHLLTARARRDADARLSASAGARDGDHAARVLRAPGPIRYSWRMQRIDRRLVVPSRLAAVVLGAAALGACSGATPADAGDAAQTDVAEAGSDVAMQDVQSAPDCAFTCMNEFFPDQDGGVQHVVFYADGAQSTDAECDAPAFDPRCGV